MTRVAFTDIARNCDWEGTKLKNLLMLISLKTIASESFQNCTKDFIGVPQPIVSKTLNAFTDCNY